jgi:hypothetical protein
MRSVLRTRRAALVGLAMVAVVTAPQSSWAGLGSDMNGGRWVRLNWEHTSFASYDNGLFDANWLVEGRVALGSNVGLRVELPLARASIPVSFMSTDTRTAVALGNLYFGLDLPAQSGGGVWEFGVWVPTSSDKDFEDVMALSFAASADFVRGLERFFPNTKGVFAMLHLREDLGPRLLSLRGDIGASVADLAGRKIKPFLLAGGRLELSMPTGTALAIGLDTRLSISDPLNDFAFTDAVIELRSRFLPVVSAVQLRRPIDSDRADVLNWTLGLSIKASLP